MVRSCTWASGLSSREGLGADGDMVYWLQLSKCLSQGKKEKMSHSSGLLKALLVMGPAQVSKP